MLYIDNEYCTSLKQLKDYFYKLEYTNTNTFVDLLDRGRDGEIAQWLRDIGEETVAEQVDAIDVNLSDSDYVNRLNLAITGQSSSICTRPDFYKCFKIEDVKTEQEGAKIVINVILKVLMSVNEEYTIMLHGGKKPHAQVKFVTPYDYVEGEICSIVFTAVDQSELNMLELYFDGKSIKISELSNIGFINLKKWNLPITAKTGIDIAANETLIQKNIWPIELSKVNLDYVIKAGYTPKSVIGHDDKNYILLASIDNRNCVVDTRGRFLYKFTYGHAVPTKTGKFLIVKRLGPDCRYYGLIKVDDGKELLPCTYHNTDSLCENIPGFFSSMKIGTYCATLESHCEYIDEKVFLERKYWRLYSLITGCFIDFKELFNLKISLFGSWRFDFKSNIYFITYSPPIGEEDYRFSILLNSNADKYYILKTDECLHSVSNDRIIIKQFGEVSTILDNSFQPIFALDYVLAKDEVVTRISEGMTIISVGNTITRILDDKFNNIISKITFLNPNYSVLQSLKSYTSLEFKKGLALFYISNKLIGGIDANGNIIQIPWNFGKRISSFEVLFPNLILVRKTSEEWYIINLKGENVIPTRRWDNIRIVSDSQIEIYNCSSSKLYEIQGNNVQEVL